MIFQMQLESLNHSHNRLFKTQIHPAMKMTALMKPLNHWINWSIQKYWILKWNNTSAVAFFGNIFVGKTKTDKVTDNIVTKMYVLFIEVLYKSKISHNHAASYTYNFLETTHVVSASSKSVSHVSSVCRWILGRKVYFSVYYMLQSEV